MFGGGVERRVVEIGGEEMGGDDGEGGGRLIGCEVVNLEGGCFIGGE